MFEELRITNLNRADLSPLTLSLYDRREYKIKYIDGLNPPPATIVTSEYAFIEGSRFQNAKSEPRNIVMTLGFNPSYSDGLDYTDLRRGLYPYLTPKANIQLDFVLDTGKILTIEGYVETHEASIFTKDPLAQISIICPDPYFEDRSEENEVFQTLTWSAGSVYYNLDIPYDGDVPNGLTLRVEATGATKSWTHLISHDGSGSLQSFNIKPDNVLSSSQFEVRTTPGQKNVLFGNTPAFDAITINSDWLMLRPGINRAKGVIMPRPSPDPSGVVIISWVNLYGGL